MRKHQIFFTHLHKNRPQPTRDYGRYIGLLAEKKGFEPPMPKKGIPDFESGAFDLSATSPNKVFHRLFKQNLADKKGIRTRDAKYWHIESISLLSPVHNKTWRRKRDSNPRCQILAYYLSKVAHSTALPSLPVSGRDSIYMIVFFANLFSDFSLVSLKILYSWLYESTTKNIS